MSNTPNTSSQRTVSRRTVAKGMAWAVPAVTVAGALPASAVSGTVSASFLSACKNPGNSCNLYPTGYVVGFTVTNNTTKQIQINIDCVTDATLNNAPVMLSVIGSESWLIDQGQSQTIYVGLSDNGSSPEAAISGTAHYTWWAPDETPADCSYGSVNFNAADTPPCESGTTGQNRLCPPPATGTPTTGANPCDPNPACA